MTIRALSLIVKGMWSRRAFPLWFFGLLIIAVLARSLVLGAIWVVVFIGYLVSVRLHPRVRHTACNGSGEKRAFFYPWRFRRCSGCQGGRQVTWGAGHLGTGRLRGEYQAVQQAQKNTRFWQRW